MGPRPLPWVSPALSQPLEAGRQLCPRRPTFHMVPLAQLDPAEVGDSPQGDVEALGHAHLKAVKVHLELRRDGRELVELGPLSAHPWPGQFHPAQLEPRVWGRGGGAPIPSALGGRAPGRALDQVAKRGGQPGAGQGTGAAARHRLGAGPASPGQTLVSPAAPPAAGGRP